MNTISSALQSHQIQLAPCTRASCVAVTALRCATCHGVAFCGEACAAGAAVGWVAHAATCRAATEAGGRTWEYLPLAPVVPLPPVKRLWRVDVAFAAARGDALAPPATLLCAASTRLTWRTARSRALPMPLLSTCAASTRCTWTAARSQASPLHPLRSLMTSSKSGSKTAVLTCRRRRGSALGTQFKRNHATRSLWLAAGGTAGASVSDSEFQASPTCTPAAPPLQIRTGK